MPPEQTSTPPPTQPKPSKLVPFFENKIIWIVFFALVVAAVSVYYFTQDSTDTVNISAESCIDSLYFADRTKYDFWKSTYGDLHPELHVYDAGSYCLLGDDTQLVSFSYFKSNGTGVGTGSDEAGQSIVLFDSNNNLLRETKDLYEHTLGDLGTPQIESVKDSIAKFVFSSGDAGVSINQAYELKLSDMSFTKLSRVSQEFDSSSGVYTYTNSQYGFSVRYPSDLSPVDNIDVATTGFGPVVFALSAVKSEFEKANFVIHVKNGAASTCAMPPQGSQEGPAPESSVITINGTEFLTYTGGDAGLGQFIGWRVYKTSVQNACITLEIYRHGVEASHLTEAEQLRWQSDRAQNDAKLDQIIQSFTFVGSTSKTPVTKDKIASQTPIVITNPVAGSTLSPSQKTTVRWTIPTTVLDSFPEDFDLGVMLYAEKQGQEGINHPVGDGYAAAAGSATWDIPGYISYGQLSPGTYRITAQLQATPKDRARTCAEEVGGDCSPNAADRAVMLRASNIKGVSGWFTIQ